MSTKKRPSSVACIRFVQSWPRTMPRWLRGIAKDRAKIMGRRGLDAPKHAELLHIHRPTISPEMEKHPQFVCWFCIRGLNDRTLRPAE